MQRREKLTHLPYFPCRTVAALDRREQPIFSPIHALLNRNYNTNIMFKNAVSRFQGPKLRLPGRQCDQKFSSGDQNFVVGRQLATGKAGCHCRLSRSEKMIKN